MTTASNASEGAGRNPLFSTGYKNIVLSLLMLAYTLNFIDRTIIATIGQAIKVDLKLTDTQLGLLGGFAFAILYTVFGIPLARLAERWKRVWIISLALLVWSGFTALCGAAMSFGQLLAFRVGVGVGVGVGLGAMATMRSIATTRKLKECGETPLLLHLMRPDPTALGLCRLLS